MQRVRASAIGAEKEMTAMPTLPFLYHPLRWASAKGPLNPNTARLRIIKRPLGASRPKAAKIAIKKNSKFYYMEN